MKCEIPPDWCVGFTTRFIHHGQAVFGQGNLLHQAQNSLQSQFYDRAKMRRNFVHIFLRFNQAVNLNNLSRKQQEESIGDKILMRNKQSKLEHRFDLFHCCYCCISYHILCRFVHIELML